MALEAPSTETLDCTVRLAMLPCSALPDALFTLLELCLFSSVETTFLNVTVTDRTTISIIAEAHVLERLSASAPESVVQDECEWAVVRVGEGSLGFESVGVIERITEPLARHQIPVLYTSTYSTDYCLIPRERLDEALQVLTTPAAHLPVDGGSTSLHTHPLTVMDCSTSIMQLEKAHRQQHTGALLRMLFMPRGDDPHQAIVSLTETADEISLVAGAAPWWDEHMRTAQGLQDDPQVWVPIRVGDEHGTPLEETGVVATQAKVLAEANLSILYLSTFYSDYTLVQRDDVDCAADAFETRGFRCARQQTVGEHEDPG